MKGIDYREIYASQEKSVMNYLQLRISKKLKFHTPSRIQEIVKLSEAIAQWEGTGKDEIFLVKMGALYKYSGLADALFGDYLTESKKYMKRNLLQCPNVHIKQIHAMQNLMEGNPSSLDPQRRLCKILCDAETDYFGREDFFELNEKNRREIQNKLRDEQHNPKFHLSLRIWNEHILKKLENHKYHTEVSNKSKKAGKEFNMNELKQLLGIK